MSSLRERNWMFLSILGALCLFSLNFVNGQLQCPVENQVTVLPNGTVIFGPLSEGSGPVDASYDPGAIGGWNALANGFAGSVQRSSLPYDLILSAINSTFISSQSQSFDPLGFLQNFAAWWAGILVVTLLGIFFGILFLIVGSCFWCCRCCGNCGGAKSQRSRERNDCMTFTFAAILLLCTLILLAAAVLAFFSNEQTFRSVDNIQTTLNSVVQNSANYLNDTTREVDDLICQFSDGQEGVLQAVNREIDGIQRDLMTTIDDISGQLTGLISELNASAISDVSTQLTALNSSFSAVETTLNSIRTDLTNVRNELNMTFMDCTGAGLGDSCTPLMEVRDAVAAALFQIPEVPNLSDQIREIADAISGIGGTVTDGQNALMDAIGPQIMEQINSTLSQVTPFIEQANTTFVSLSDELNSVVRPLTDTSFSGECPSLDGVNNAFTQIDLPQVDFSGFFGQGGGATPTQSSDPNRFALTLGYINECIINASFEYIREFDVYRYAVGIVICCLALITIVLIWTGLLFGLLGFRKDRFPHDRSKVSHCGGIFLLISVGLTFLFGFFLLLLSSIFFFLGSNSLELCQSIQGPNYELFANIIDRPEVKLAIARNQTIANAIPSISGFLRDCEVNNSALYTATNLNDILDATVPDWAGSIEGTIMQLFNFAALQQTVDSSISEAAANLNLNPEQITDVIQMALSSIPNDTLNINVTGIIAQVQTAVDAANLNDSIMSLRNISAMLTMSNQDSLATSINNTANTLENIRDMSLVTLFMQLDQLGITVDALDSAADGLRQNVTMIADEITAVVTNISGPVIDQFINNTIRGAVDRSFGFLSQYISNLDDQVVNTVGGCQPIYGVYTQLHNTVCRNFLDGLNGFWWSLGFCSLLFIPVIIFAVITSSFFLRKKSTEEEDDAYLAYPMKSY